MSDSSTTEAFADTALAGALAEHLREHRTDLVARWLERINARVALTPRKIFPTEELLNHVPLLIDGIADYLERPDKELDSDVPVAAKAMELGALRHAQGFDAYEILKEHELLGAIIFSSLADVVDDIEVDASRRALAICWQRVAHAIELIRQTTMTHFLRLSGERVADREARLRRFNRMVAHELKNRVGAIRGAGALLSEPWIDSQARERFQRMITENADGLQHVLTNLEALSQLESETRQRKNVLLPQVCTESVRQLRAMAQARDVEVVLEESIPAVEVDAAGVELCLVNYISNAIKYSDPDVEKRWVRVDAEYQPGVGNEGELVVRVRDNGLGVPAASRERLFEQFYRAHGQTVTDVEGTGLGLSIVRETAESLGGRAWAEFPDERGVVFAFSLPSRREEDAAAAGTRRPDGVER